MRLPPAVWRASWSLLFIFGCGAGAPVSPTTEELVVQKDVEGLRELVAVPAELDRAAWVIRSRGSGGMGPVDYEIWALLPLVPDTITRLDSIVGPSLGTNTVAVPAEVGFLLMPGVSAPDTDLRLHGTARPTRVFDRLPYRGDFALEVPGGLVVHWTTM